jgi:hypothetical protein
MENQSWYIVDWANNHIFGNMNWKSFDDAEEFLCEFLDDNYETDRQEYYILERDLK